jgi:GNAT superfamily N-acetyltransferase
MAFVRAARPDDAGAIAAIHLRAWRDRYPSWPETVWHRLEEASTEPSWRAAIAEPPSPEHLILVATDDSDRVCGFATIAPGEELDHTLIELLEVDPVSRRAGHGSRLISAVVAHSDHREGLLFWIDQGSDASRFLVDSGWGPRGHRRVLEIDADLHLPQHEWWTRIGDE